jgi:hypothetical protein
MLAAMLIYNHFGIQQDLKKEYFRLAWVTYKKENNNV